MKPAWYTEGYLTLASALAYLFREHWEGRLDRETMDAALAIFIKCGIQIRNEVNPL